MLMEVTFWKEGGNWNNSCRCTWLGLRALDHCSVWTTPPFLINLITMTSHQAFQGVISGLKDKPCTGSHQQPPHEISPTLTEEGPPPWMQICSQFLLTLWKIAAWEVNICLDLTGLCHRSASRGDAVHMCSTCACKFFSDIMQMCQTMQWWYGRGVVVVVICYHIFDRLHLCGLSGEVWHVNLSCCQHQTFLIFTCFIFLTELDAFEKNYMEGVGVY